MLQNLELISHMQAMWKSDPKLSKYLKKQKECELNTVDKYNQ